jgi:glucose/mannose transport system substrate-binding protein
VVHGSAAPADFQQALNDAVTTFVVDQDVEAFAAALVAGAKLAGFAPKFPGFVPGRRGV